MEQAIQEMKNLRNEELLSLYTDVMNHLKYLDENIISITEVPNEDGDENDE